jgi:hypothetical protein
MRRVVRMTAVACGFLAVGGTVAWATGLTNFGFVGSDGTITACVQNSNGNVRFIDSTSAIKDLSSCRSGESSVSFNQVGQQGPQGPQGPPGSPPGPAHVLVDCSAGQSVSQALNQNADATNLQIAIKGTCTEFVNISRDNVSLNAVSAGDGLAAPGNGPALFIRGRLNRIDGLTITGGAGLNVSGGQVDVNNATISGGSSAVSAGGNGNASVSNSTLSAANEVVHAAQGGSVQLNNVTVLGAGAGSDGIVAQTGGSVTSFGGDVSGARFAVIAYPGGSAEIDDGTIHDNLNGGLFAFGGGIHASGGSVTRSTFAGASAAAGGVLILSSGIDIAHNSVGVESDGGHILIQDGAIVENNAQDGVRATNASSVSIVNGATFIRNNGGDGVHLSGTTVASLDAGQVITGNGAWGIFCDGPPNVALIRGDSSGVSGNSAGQVACSTG